MMRPTNQFPEQCPTEDEALAALAELVGRPMAEGIWDLSAAELDLTRPLQSSADLRRMSEYLMQVGDLLRVAGRSTKIRVITFEALSRTLS
jgi:hypothetical protein